MNKPEDAVPVCRTLVEHGIKIVEITLRTSCWAEAIKNVKNSDVDIIVGSGTVISLDQYKQSEKIGVDFIVSPGSSDELLQYANVSNTLYLPGVMTSSEILRAYNYGFKFQKLFPAALAGGITALKTYKNVYQDVKFCPTGGVNFDNFKDYLSLSNVCAVGGTWIASSDEIASNDWDNIGNKAAAVIEKSYN